MNPLACFSFYVSENMSWVKGMCTIFVASFALWNQYHPRSAKLILLSVRQINYRSLRTAQLKLARHNVRACDNWCYRTQSARITSCAAYMNWFHSAQASRIDYLRTTSIRMCLRSAQSILTFRIFRKLIPAPAQREVKSRRLCMARVEWETWMCFFW